MERKVIKIIDQDIPAELYRQYQRSLGFAQETKSGSGIYSIRKRPPYRLPHMQSERGNSPSAAQLAVRQAFKDSVDCFNGSPRSGGAVPPELGYRSREWWFASSSASIYPPYVDRDFATWDGEEIEPDDWLGSDDVEHPQPWFLQTDEPDFIDFYDEMKGKYGYPWSSRNSPDEIVTKMNQIVCDEITYDPDANPFMLIRQDKQQKAEKEFATINQFCIML